MKSCCRRFWCYIFCCQCRRKTNLELITDETKLLPKSEVTRSQIEKNELTCFGSIPVSLQIPKLLDSINSTAIKRIVCGNNHCLILFTDHSLFGFGGNEQGQLGLPLQQKEVSELTSLKFKLQQFPEFTIEDIACGDVFSIVLIKSNEQYYLIRFGLEQRDKYKEKPGDINPITIENLPREDMIIKSISAFGKRKIIVTENNEVYMSGIDFMNNKIDEYISLEFSGFGKEIKTISLGLNHCVILTNDAEVYGIGDNTYGELGVQEQSLNAFRMIRLGLIAKIKKIECGARHTLILLNNGDLYVLGDNSENQCYGYEPMVRQPIQIKMDFQESKVIDCYAGNTHNLVVLENGDILTWGDASMGKLGYEEEHFTQGIPKQILSLKYKLFSCAGLGFAMTVISTGKKEMFIGSKL